MNRRKAIAGILGLAGVGVVSFAGIRLLYGNTKSTREQLQNYKSLISELVDVIIPPTDTPGAKEAKVYDFIIDFMESCSSNKEYNNFINGLNDIQEICLSDYNTNFEGCTLLQKTEVIEDLDNDVYSNGLLAKIDSKIRGRSFINILKSLTIEGYCTSEIGATQLLSYVPVPVKYEAITSIAPNQKAWATR